MLSLEDKTWKELHGGYRIPYDASAALRSMQDGKDVWDELWNELHHQGDVGVALYPAVAELVRIAGDATTRDWNFYGELRLSRLNAIVKEIPIFPPG